jgi:hypothetical protein
MHLFAGVMLPVFGHLFVAIFVLTAFHLMNLLPCNVLQYYGMTPEKLAERTDSQV